MISREREGRFQVIKVAGARTSCDSPAIGGGGVGVGVDGGCGRRIRRELDEVTLSTIGMGSGGVSDTVMMGGEGGSLLEGKSSRADGIVRRSTEEIPPRGGCLWSVVVQYMSKWEGEEYQ
jgi:hypothetical protein